jgi:hypothetical protein
MSSPNPVADHRDDGPKSASNLLLQRPKGEQKPLAHCRMIHLYNGKRVL